ncbi:TPA: glycosyltransferase [Vibrio cholerae]
MAYKHKVIFFSPCVDFNGGAESVIKTLSEEFCHDGVVQASIISLYRQGQGLKDVVYLFENKIRLRSVIFSMLYKLRKLLLRSMPDFIVVSNYGYTWIFHFLKLVFGFRYKIVFHAHIPLGVENDKATRVSLFFDRIMNTKIVCLTNSDKINYLKSGFKKVEVIENFVSLPVVAKQGYKFFFGAVGQLNKRKNFLELVEIFSKFYANNSSYGLRIFGEGEQRDELKSLIDKLKLQDVIQLEGYVSSKEEIYGSIDVLLLTSINEGLPLCIIEGFHFSVPCIAFDCPTGPSELIKNDYSGFVVPMHSHSLFIKSMIDVVQNIERFSIAARTESHRFDRNVVLGKWYSYLGLTSRTGSNMKSVNI